MDVMEANVIALASAAVSLLGLGLVMGFTPSLYAVVLHLLTHTPKAAVMIRWVTVGMTVGATLLIVVFRFVDPETLTAALKGRVEELLIRHSVDLVAGSLLLLGAVVEYRRYRSTPFTAHKPPNHHDTESPRKMLLLGFVNTVVGVSGMATMYVTGRVITGASHHITVDLILYAVFLTAFVGPYLLAAWLWNRFPRAARSIEALSAKLARKDIRPAVVVGLALAGLVFLALGVWG